MKINKPTFIAVIGIVAIGVAVVLFPDEARNSPFEKVVEFTYSRTQPCNAEYYNYGFSIGSLRDHILCWSGKKNASQVDFHLKVLDRLKRFCEVGELQMPDAMMMEKIRRVEFSLLEEDRLVNPIKCKMVVRAESKSLAELVACAFARTMLDELELENRSMSWKATMDKASDCKRREYELAELGKRMRDKALGENELNELRAAISDAERSLKDAKSIWDASIKPYREKWDASIVFLNFTDEENESGAAR